MFVRNDFQNWKRNLLVEEGLANEERSVSLSDEACPLKTMASDHENAAV